MGGGWLHLCSFVCWSSRIIALLLCYYCIATCTFKGGISANAICHLWRFVLGFSKLVGLNRLPFAAMVAYPVALHSALLHRGYSQRIGGDCTLERTFHGSSDLFSVTELTFMDS